MAQKKTVGDVFTILLVGDMGTGKTSIILRIVNNEFKEKTAQSQSTLGVDHTNKEFEVDDYRVCVKFLDTAGQERFRTITSSYYRGAHVVLLVYDAADKGSMESVSRLWIREVERYASSDVEMYFVANMIDKEGTKEVLAEGRKVAAEIGIKHLEVSAKTGEGIDDAFKLLVREFIPKCGPQEKKTNNGSFRLDARRSLSSSAKKKASFCSI